MSKNAQSAESVKEGGATLGFGRKNLMFAGAGVVSIILGFIFLSQGSITLAPLLLVLGYVILLPLAIIL